VVQLARSHERFVELNATFLGFFSVVSSHLHG